MKTAKRNRCVARHITAHVICTHVGATLPKQIMLQLQEALVKMFVKMQTAKNNCTSSSAWVALNNSDGAIISTNFEFDEKNQGYIFNAFIRLDKFVRVFKRRAIESLNNLIRAVFIVRQGIGKSVLVPA